MAMLTREDVALTLIALGFYILVVQRRWILGAAVMARERGVVRRCCSDVVIPALGGGVAYRHWTYDALGTGPLSAASYVFAHPIDSLKLLFTPAEKARVWIGSFAAFALLPLALAGAAGRAAVIPRAVLVVVAELLVLPLPVLDAAGADPHVRRHRHVRAGDAAAGAALGAAARDRPAARGARGERA